VCHRRAREGLFSGKSGVPRLFSAMGGRTLDTGAARRASCIWQWTAVCWQRGPLRPSRLCPFGAGSGQSLTAWAGSDRTAETRRARRRPPFAVDRTRATPPDRPDQEDSREGAKNAKKRQTGETGNGFHGLHHVFRAVKSAKSVAWFFFSATVRSRVNSDSVSDTLPFGSRQSVVSLRLRGRRGPDQRIRRVRQVLVVSRPGLPSPLPSGEGPRRRQGRLLGGEGREDLALAVCIPSCVR